MYFSPIMADTDITDIQGTDTADTDILFADTDISVLVSVSAKYIG